MRPTTVFLVQLPESARTIAIEAALSVFADARIVTASTVAEAMRHPYSDGRELLVLAAPDETDLGAAADAADPCDLPRWAVVALGRISSELTEAVPPEDWNVPLLARVFRHAVQNAELIRENTRLRGDLRTVARRISHDLRTPLGCIHTTCELLKELSPSDPEMTQSMIQVVRDSSTEMGRLIDRVSYLLRMSTDGTPCESVAMGGVVDSALHDLADQINESGVVVNHPLTWPEVIGSPDALATIWVNLISNAIKHRWPDAPVILDWNPHGDDLRFSVAARGAPVPESQQNRFFQPFDQLHSQVAPGLGLSFVQRLVSLHGGHCGYERLEGDISLFYFTLPATWSRLRERATAFAVA